MKLATFISRSGRTALALSVEVGVPNQSFYRYVHGAMPPLDVALRIVRVTRGRVRIEDLVSEIEDGRRKRGSRVAAAHANGSDGAR